MCAGRVASVVSHSVAPQALLSMRFSKQEHWSGLPCPPPGYLPDPGIKPLSPASSALSVESFMAEPLEELPSHPQFASPNYIVSRFQTLQSEHPNWTPYLLEKIAFNF